MDSLDLADEEDVVAMTEDARVGMKKPHRAIFRKHWKCSVTRCLRDPPAPLATAALTGQVAGLLESLGGVLTSFVPSGNESNMENATGYTVTDAGASTAAAVSEAADKFFAQGASAAVAAASVASASVASAYEVCRAPSSLYPLVCVFYCHSKNPLDFISVWSIISFTSLVLGCHSPDLPSCHDSFSHPGSLSFFRVLL
jgi:hypothetical protein